LKRIFNRFYRAPRRVAPRVKGAGLGLFIVRSIVSKHGGRTFAESEGEGMGSVFTIELPRIQISPRLVANAAAMSAPADQSALATARGVDQFQKT
jgi:K+-sensing histidine kinase KdpD